MARHPRFALPGHTQHVIQRGNNRDITFVVDEDFQFYRDRLAEACQRFGCQLHAYVLMTNHAHLLMTPSTAAGISQVMQSLGRVYVQYFNYRYQRTGTLWEGRFKATLIDTDRYLMTCHRYIELNPVRAGMVLRPEEYRWSSFRCNALGYDDELVTEHALYRDLGADADARCYAYRALFTEALPPDAVDAIRESTNKAWVLGNDRFRERIEALSARQAGPRSRGGDRKSGQRQFGDVINRV